MTEHSHRIRVAEPGDGKHTVPGRCDCGYERDFLVSLETVEWQRQHGSAFKVRRKGQGT